MKALATTATQSWTGRILAIFCALFLLFDATIHILNPPMVVQAFGKLGFPDQYAVVIGLAEVIGVVLFCVPRTAVFGLLFFTAYLGGATALQVRIGGPAWFSVMLGLLMWISAYLQYSRVRSVLVFDGN